MSDEQLIVEVDAETSGLDRGLGDAADKVQGFGDDAERAGDKASEGFKKAEGGSAALVDSLEELKGWIEAAAAAWQGFETIAEGNSLLEMGRRLGANVSDLSAFKFGVEQAGVSLEGMEQGMVKLQRSIVEAQDPTSKQAAAFKALGYDAAAVHELLGKDLVGDLIDLVEHAERWNNDQNRMADLFELIGRGVRPFNQLIEEGSQKIRENMEAVNRWTPAQTAAAHSAAEAWGQIGDAWADLKKSVLVDTGFLERFASGMQAIATNAANLVDVMKELGRAASDAFNYGVNFWAPGTTEGPGPQGAPTGAGPAAANPQSGWDFGPPAPRPSAAPPGDPKKAAEAALKAFEALRQQEAIDLAEAGKNAELKLAIASAYTQHVAELFGLESEQYRKQQLTQTEALRTAVEQRRQIETLEVQATAAMIDKQLALQEQAVQTSAEMGDISSAEEFAQLRDLLERRYQAKKDALERERELVRDAGGGPLAEAQLDAKGSALDAQHQLDLMNLARQQLHDVQTLGQQVGSIFQGVFTSIGQAFDRSVLGILQGTQRLQRGMAQAGQAIAAQWISNAVQRTTIFAGEVAKQIAIEAFGQATMTAIEEKNVARRVALALVEMARKIWAAVTGSNTAAEEATRSAIQTTAVDRAMADVELHAQATVAGAKAAAAVADDGSYGASSITLMNTLPNTIIGIGEGLMNSGGVAAAGGFDVPRDVTARLHAREMVLPAHLAERVREMTTPTRAGAMVVNVSAMDTKGVHDALHTNRHGLRQVMRTLQRESNRNVTSRDA